MVRRVVYAGAGGWIGGLRGRSSRGYWQAEQEVLSAALIAPQCGQKRVGAGIYLLLEAYFSKPIGNTLLPAVLSLVSAQACSMGTFPGKKTKSKSVVK
jgi:hypothetical protein